MFQFEIRISERRGLDEIIAFNRNKTDKHIEKWQHLYQLFKNGFPLIHIYTSIVHPLTYFFSKLTFFYSIKK